MIALARDRKGLAYIAFVTVCIVWGTTYLGIHVALETVPVLLVAGLRWMFAGVVMSALDARNRTRPAEAALVGTARAPRLPDEHRRQRLRRLRAAVRRERSHRGADRDDAVLVGVDRAPAAERRALLEAIALRPRARFLGDRRPGVAGDDQRRRRRPAVRDRRDRDSAGMRRLGGRHVVRDDATSSATIHFDRRRCRWSSAASCC